VDVDDFVTATVREACDAHPDLIVLHDHSLGKQIARRGCQNAMVIDGRSFRRRGLQRIATADGHTALEYTVGSSGGHISTRPNPGRIRHPASFEAFTFDAFRNLHAGSIGSHANRPGLG